jgi:hypothetical protein
MISETSLMTAREVLVHSNLAKDLDASIRFVNAAVDTLRYCPGIGWLRWDGRRWAENAEWAAVEFAKKMARAWLKKTARSGDRSKVTEAAYMEMAPRIHAVVKLAESDACMRIEAN